MKKILLATYIILISCMAIAQAPQKFNYQAVLRNNSGEIISNKKIALKFEIVSISDSKVVYTETNKLETNSLGLISTQIGAGETADSFEDIKWNADEYLIRTSFDTEGDGIFTVMGESQLVSVPYALFAASSGNKQKLSINGYQISLTDGGSITLPADNVDDADADPANEIQQLSLKGDTLFLSGGGNIILPKSSFSGSFNDLTDVPATLDLNSDDDFSGNYQDLTNKPNWSDSIIAHIPDLTGYDSNAADDFDGNYFNLANLPNWSDSINQSLPDMAGFDSNAADDFSGNYADLTNTPNWSDSIDAHVPDLSIYDTSNTNEIQDLTLDGNILIITNNSNATPINLTPFTGTNTDEQTLSLSGTQLSISNGNTLDLSTLQDGVNDADADATNEIQTLSISGGIISLTDGGSVTIPDGFSGNYNDLTNKPDFSGYDTDASDDFSGNYNDLSNKPTLGGDVTGSLGANSVVKLRGMEISSTSPANGQILKWNSANTAWEPSDDALGAAGTTDGVVTSVAVTGTTTKTITLSRSNSLGDLTGSFTDNVDDADASTTNEIQDLNLNTVTHILTITNNSSATSINLSAYLDDTDTQLSEAEVDSYVSNNGYVAATSTTGWDKDASDDFSGNYNDLSNKPDLSNYDTDVTDDFSGDYTDLANKPVLATVATSGAYADLSGKPDLSAYDANAADDFSGNYNDLSNKPDLSNYDTDVTDDFSGNYADLANKPVLATVATSGAYADLSGKPDLSAYDANAADDFSGNYNDLSNKPDLSNYDTDVTDDFSGNYADLANKPVLATVATSGAYADLSGKPDLSSYLTSEVDGSNTNELQTLSLSGSNLTISGSAGNTVSLSTLKGAFATSSSVTSNSSGAYSTDDFVFGSPSLDYSGTSTESERMFFDKSKSAFRAGKANTTDWDVANIGEYSFGAGFASKASGSASAALGRATSASGVSSFAVGFGSSASNSYSMAGGYNATATSQYALSYGYATNATGNYAVALGNSSQASGASSFAAGQSNTSSAIGTTVFGVSSQATANYGFAAGYLAQADGIASVGLGYSAQANADYSLAFGHSAVVDAANSIALGANASVGSLATYTTAIGRYARGYYDGSFVACDGSSTSNFNGVTSNSFATRFVGGYYLYTNSGLTTGVYISAGGSSWSSASDSTKKENFKPVDGDLFLQKISEFKLTSWNYKGQDKTKFRHYGPMAQDFYAAFGNDGIGTVGCDTLIATADFLGVNFIAIQALEERTRELKNVQEELKASIKEIEELKKVQTEMQGKLSELEMVKAEIESIRQYFEATAHNK